LRVRFIPLAQLEDREISAWRELAANAVEPNPFFDPDYVIPAARGLGAWDEVALACAGEESEWAACLPVRRHSRWRRLPLPGISTWRHSYCLLGTPLLAPGQVEEALPALVEAMRRSPGVAFAALEWVPAEGPIAEALGTLATAPVEFEAINRATLVRRPEADYLEGHVKGKHRREFRRLARAMSEELGEELELVERCQDPEAVEAFLALEDSGWKGREGTSLLSNPDHAEFFRQSSRAFAARGELELLFLEAGGKAAAARYSLLGGGASFCFKVAYDEDLGRYSPGRELELRLIERFHEDGKLAWMDSCADSGNELFKRLWPDRRNLLTHAYPAPGARGALAKAGLRTVSTLQARRAARAVQR
jgi:CelD/BcsL family acetyltransferase involved in cellulose biosynthesis